MTAFGTRAAPARLVRSLRRQLAAVRAASLPLKIVVLVTFLSSLGAGLYLTGSSVYFVRSVGLSAVQVGAGLSVSAFLGIIAGVPVGYLTERFGARNVTAALMVAAAPVLLALATVRSFPPFLIWTSVLGMLVLGVDVAVGVLIAELAGPDQALDLGIYVRVAFNAGFSVGLLGAGVAITIGTRTAYYSLFAGDALVLAVGCILLLVLLPRVKPTAPPEGGGRLLAAFRDLPYLLVGQISGLTRLGDTILTAGLPLWIVARTAAPRGLAAWLLVINTLMVVFLQTRAARRADGLPGAVRVQRWGFVALCASCVAISPSSALGPWAAAIVLLLGTITLTLGEMWGEGAWWWLRYGLASADSQGAYGAAFGLGQAVPRVIGPVLVTALTMDLGTAGWLLLAGIFAACAAGNGRLLTWAARAGDSVPSDKAVRLRYRFDRSIQGD